VNRYKIQNTAILLIPALLIFTGIDFILRAILPTSSGPAFIITFFIILYFRSFWQQSLERLFMPQRQRLISETVNLLQLLNYRLNSSRRYDEVIKALEEAFSKLFSGRPFALYISADDACKLVVSPPGIRKKLRGFKLPHKNFRFTDEEALVIDVQQSALPENIRQKLLQEDLTQILPFYGQSRLAAMLFVNYRRLSLLRIPPVQTLFEQIQKKTGLILENSAGKQRPVCRFGEKT